jgi:hypothetical protein
MHARRRDVRRSHRQRRAHPSCDREAENLGSDVDIRIVGGLYVVSTSLVFTTNANTGVASTITLEPLGDEDVTLVAAPGFVAPVIRNPAARRIFRRLTIVDAYIGIRLETSTSDFNTITECRFVNAATAAWHQILNEGDNNVIARNLFEHIPAPLAVSPTYTHGITVGASSGGGTISQNIFRGRFEDAVYLGSTDLGHGPIFIDHNSVLQTDVAPAMDAFHFNGLNPICMRNNLSISLSPVVYEAYNNGGTLASTEACLGHASENNVAVGPPLLCDGVTCDVLCPAPGQGPLCDVELDGLAPNEDLCPTLELPVAELGHDVGAVFLDDGLPFAGNAPPIGAHETGSIRRYGDVVIACP